MYIHIFALYLKTFNTLIGSTNKNPTQMKKVLLTFVALGLMASASIAQTTWKIDKAHSWVNFQVLHQGLSYVNGSFSKFDATIETKGKGLDGAKLTANINPASVKSGNKRRDDHLKGKDFFNVEKFPKISFISKKFKKAGKNKFKITGDLTFHGVTKEVTMNAKKMGSFAGKKGKKVGFVASTTINRYDFGVTWGKDYKTPNGDAAVAADVKITVNIELSSANTK